MFGMYTLFQGMFSSWQNQMTEQYERSRPQPQQTQQPQQQYAVVMANPCQISAMMGGMGGCNSPQGPSIMMSPGCGGGFGGGGASGGMFQPNTIFEVTGVEMRGDANR